MKKIILLGVAICLVLSVVGCGFQKKLEIEPIAVKETEQVKPDAKPETTTKPSEDALMNMVNNEMIGELKLNMTIEDAQKIIGEPDSKTEATQWATDGLMHSCWTYKEKGLVINIAGANDVPYAIYNIEAGPKCTLKTSKGIGIGSSRKEVTNAYQAYIDNANTSQTSIIVGSIYNGVEFGLESSAVVRIFIGAMAE